MMNVTFDGRPAPVDVVDISVGGFAVQSPATVPLGELHRAEFHHTLSDKKIRLRAKCVHCRPDPEAAGHYRIGFCFVTWGDGDSKALAQLIDLVTGVLSFD